VIDLQTKKKWLESAIYDLSENNCFYAGLIQEMSIQYNDHFPTAGITYDKEKEVFRIIIGTQFFSKLTTKERSAIMMHEILHFCNGHLFRFNFNHEENKEAWLDNIATDMAINQFIEGLPFGCEKCKDLPVSAKCPDPKNCKGKHVRVQDFKYLDPNGIEQPFPQFKSSEEYLKLLKENRKANNPNLKMPSEQKGKGKQKAKQAGSTGNQGEGEEEGSQQPGETGNEGPNKQVLDAFKPMDEHNWGDGDEPLDAETKEKLLKEAKKVIERTLEKTSYDKSAVPGGIKDLLKDLDVIIGGINYKRIIFNAIKKTLSGIDRKNTWKKPNKRYGMLAPGTKNGDLPSISFFADSSGSISHTELNEFFGVMNNFLKVGVKKCMLGLWHTSLYRYQKYRYNQEFDKNNVESGGTDVTEVLKKIAKDNIDLAIIITDGYYSAENVNLDDKEIIWVISKGGTVEHPLKSVGKTVQII